jgi:hypothetical protein
MRTSQRNPTSRRPAKVKGSLPSPVMAPQHLHRAWYRRPPVLVLGGLVLLALLGFGVWKGFQLRAESQERKQQQRAVRLYERNLALLQAPVKPIFQELTRSPDQFLAAELTREEFKAQTDTWVTGFEKLFRELQRRDGEVPAHLQEANALFAQGAVVYLDSVKSFQTAALATEPAVRDLAIQQGKNLAYHAGIIFGNGIRAVEEQKRRLKMEVTELNTILDDPVLIPEETVPAQPTIPGG